MATQSSGPLNRKVIDPKIFLQLIVELNPNIFHTVSQNSDLSSSAFTSNPLYESEIFDLISGCVGGMYDMNIHKEIFQQCLFGSSNPNENSVSLNKYVNVMGAAEHQLLLKIDSLTEANLLLQLSLVDLEQQKEQLCKNNANLPPRSFLKVNIEQLEIAFEEETFASCHAFFVKFSLPNEFPSIRTSSKNIPFERQQSNKLKYPFQQIFNIPIQKAQSGLKIEIYGELVSGDLPIVIASQIVPLNQYIEGQQVNQKINFVCDPLKASHCSLTTTTLLNQDHIGYLETAKNQVMLTQQENSREKIQYENDLFQIQQPILQLLTRFTNAKRDYRTNGAGTQRGSDTDPITLYAASVSPYAPPTPIDKAKAFLRKPIVYNAPNQPIQIGKNDLQSTKEDVQKSNKVAILVAVSLIYFAVSAVGCFSRAYFVDVMVSCALLMIVGYNATHQTFISFCQACLFFAFLLDIIFLTLHQDLNEMGVGESRQMLHLRRNLHKIEIGISLLNIIIRASLIYLLHVLSNLLREKQASFSFGTDPLEFQIGGKLVSNPLSEEYRKNHMESQYYTP